MNTDEEKLIERLRSIERLFAGATTPGERSAAADARDRVRKRTERTKRRGEAGNGQSGQNGQNGG